MLWFPPLLLVDLSPGPVALHSFSEPVVPHQRRSQVSQLLVHPLRFATCQLEEHTERAIDVALACDAELVVVLARAHARISSESRLMESYFNGHTPDRVMNHYTVMIRNLKRVSPYHRLGQNAETYVYKCVQKNIIRVHMSICVYTFCLLDLPDTRNSQ